MQYAALLLALLLPAAALAQSSAQEVTVSQNASVAGESVPLEAVVSTEESEYILSTSKQEGAVPVTITIYVAPKPKPAPAASSSQVAAAVESSEAIRSGISGLSPQAGEVVAPFFRLVDGGRQAAADVLDTQIAQTKERLGPEAGSVLGEETKNAAQNPMGAFWYVLQTLLLYIFTILRWLVGNAGVFYPVFALGFFYILWRVIRRFRRPSY